MIAHLRGKLAQKDPARVIVDVNGVGYEVFIPLTTFSSLPNAGSEVSIDVHTHVREDVIALYGFSTRRERSIFEKLMTISGIGPKLAQIEPQVLEFADRLVGRLVVDVETEHHQGMNETF